MGVCYEQNGVMTDHHLPPPSAIPAWEQRTIGAGTWLFGI